MADVIDYRIYGDDMQVVEIELDPGEGVRAEAGAMMFMEDGIEMQTSTGGEGIFLARLTGPGAVYLQSLPFSRLADRIMAAARFQQRGEQPGVAGLGGGILGGIFGGDGKF